MTDAIVEHISTDLATLFTEDSFEALWNMLQNEDGSPMSLEANQLLLNVYEGTMALVRERDEYFAQVSGLAATLQNIKADRDMLAHDLQRRVEAAKERGEKAEYRRIVRAFAMERGLSDEAADYLLQFIIGEGTHAVTPYVQRVISQALDGVIDDLEAEVDDEFNRETEETEYHDDED